MKEFKKLLNQKNEPLFDSIEMEIDKSMEVSSNSMLYQVIKCNSSAKAFFKSSEDDLNLLSL